MNLKSQCYFKLADLVKEGKINICQVDNEVKDRIIEDLEQIKWYNPDKDVRIQVTPKEKIKEKTGKSPDFGDTLMMRMFYEIKVKYKPYVAY